MNDEWTVDTGFDPVSLTPKQFEQEIRSFFAAIGAGLKDLTVQHNEVIPAPDGDYQMDATARFEAFGLNFLLLIECKHHKNPVKREAVQALQGKLQSLGAHKGVICATGGFQLGALRYARLHGIGLINIVDGRAVYAVKDRFGQHQLPPWGRPYVARLVWVDDAEGSPRVSFHSQPGADVWLRVLGINEPA